MASRIFKHYKIQVGLSMAGNLEFESLLLPEYNHGLMFIVERDGCHHAIAIRCVDGVSVKPIFDEVAQ